VCPTTAFPCLQFRASPALCCLSPSGALCPSRCLQCWFRRNSHCLAVWQWSILTPVCCVLRVVVKPVHSACDTETDVWPLDGELGHSTCQHHHQQHAQQQNASHHRGRSGSASGAASAASIAQHAATSVDSSKQDVSPALRALGLATGAGLAGATPGAVPSSTSSSSGRRGSLLAGGLSGILVGGGAAAAIVGASPAAVPASSSAAAAAAASSALMAHQQQHHRSVTRSGSRDGLADLTAATIDDDAAQHTVSPTHRSSSGSVASQPQQPQLQLPHSRSLTHVHVHLDRSSWMRPTRSQVHGSAAAAAGLGSSSSATGADGSTSSVGVGSRRRPSCIGTPVPSAVLAGNGGPSSSPLSAPSRPGVPDTVMLQHVVTFLHRLLSYSDEYRVQVCREPFIRSLVLCVYASAPLQPEASTPPPGPMLLPHNIGPCTLVDQWSFISFAPTPLQLVDGELAVPQLIVSPVFSSHYHLQHGSHTSQQQQHNHHHARARSHSHSHAHSHAQQAQTVPARTFLPKQPPPSSQLQRGQCCWHRFGPGCCGRRRLRAFEQQFDQWLPAAPAGWWSACPTPPGRSRLMVPPYDSCSHTAP
jgi:hypothetical protein